MKKREREMSDNRHAGDTDSESPGRKKQANSPWNLALLSPYKNLNNEFPKGCAKVIEFYNRNYPHLSLELISQLLNKKININAIETEVNFLQDQINLLSSQLEKLDANNPIATTLRKYHTKYQEMLDLTNSLRFCLRVSYFNNEAKHLLHLDPMAAEAKEIRRLATLWIRYFNYDMLGILSLIRVFAFREFNNSQLLILNYHHLLLNNIYEFMKISKKLFPEKTQEIYQENIDFRESIEDPLNEITTIISILSSLTNTNTDHLKQNANIVIENINFLFELDVLEKRIDDISTLCENYEYSPPDAHQLSTITQKIEYIEMILGVTKDFISAFDAIYTHLAQHSNCDNSFFFEKYSEKSALLKIGLDTLRDLKNDLEVFKINATKNHPLIY